MSSSTRCGCGPLNTPTDACDPEPLVSQFNNIIVKLFGTVTKSAQGSVCVWSMPCNIDGEISPAYPREPNEGWACYVNRILTMGIVGEPNTGANVGSGQGLFKDKTGFDLNFRTLLEGLNIAIAQVGDDEVSIAYEYAAVPATMTSEGTAGQMAYDADYLYLCYEDDKWMRLAGAQEWTA